MGCLLALVALITPRFVIFLLWLFSNYLDRAYHSWVWPTLGFLFLPTTTLAYAVARNEFNGFRGIGLVILLIGFAIDLGLWRGGARNRRWSAA